MQRLPWLLLNILVSLVITLGIDVHKICPECNHCVKSVQIRSFFWPVFSRIRNEYGEILRISPYSVRMWGNTDQKNSVFGQFSRSQSYQIFYLRFVDVIMSGISKIRNVRYFSGISTLILKSPVNGGVAGLLSPFSHCFSSSFSFAISFYFDILHDVWTSPCSNSSCTSPCSHSSFQWCFFSLTFLLQTSLRQIFVTCIRKTFTIVRRKSFSIRVLRLDLRFWDLWPGTLGLGTRTMGPRT